MTDEWLVEPPRGQCASSGRTFLEGEEFYTVLFEEGESFRRADYSPAAWQGPPAGAFCFFKSRVPFKERRKKLLIDNDLLLNFFQRLALETQSVRVEFRFVLALILIRKKLLRYEQSEIQDGVEIWNLTLPKDQSTHRVVNPRLTDDRVEGVSRELSAILHGDMGDWSMRPTENGFTEESEALRNHVD